MTHKHIWTKANTDKLCETMQKSMLLTYQKETTNLRVRFDPFLLLEFSPPLESCSDISACPTSCLIIINLLFNVLFLRYFPLFYLPVLSIYSRSANICPVHSNWALYHYKTRPLTADWLQVVLLSSTKIMTKYRRQRTFITWRKRDETQRKCWSCDDDYN